MSSDFVGTSALAPSISGGAKNDFPWYAMRHWHGMKAKSLLSLFWEHGFRLDNRLMALSAFGTSCLNSINGMAQKAIFSRAVKKTQIRQPVFILGHWRSGTTMLHEYLNLDPAFRAPTTLETACPEHHLLSKWFVQRFLACPSKRPMDEMAAGWSKPQECEFALMCMGQRSMYTHLGFPNDDVSALDTLNFFDTPQDEIQRWGRALTTFFQSVLLRSPGTLLLKSPTHTGRVAKLLELFPDAKFIHISRSPERFIPSTIHLWKQLGKNCCFQQTERGRGVDFVIDCFQRMYAGYFSAVEEIPTGNLIEIRYEDFVQDPLAGTEQIYDTLSLSGFDDLRPTLEAEVAARADYRRNSLELTAKIQTAIADNCGQYCEHFGY